MAAEAAPKAPPSLRASTEEDRECDQCSYFARGHCSAFPPLVVDGEWVCDHFKASGEPDPDDQPSKGGSPLDEASQRALIQVRAHTRNKTSPK